jgi:flagellum-specific peptidoglycan hydrolase FlgJ
MWPVILGIGLMAWLLYEANTGAPLINPGKQSPQDFVNTWYGTASDIQGACGMPAIFQLAQAAEESGWGGSDVCLKANNYFGIKADSSWKGDTYNGYRKYDKPYDSWEDHATYLLTNANYKTAFKYTDPTDFAVAVAGAGYATDPAYLGNLTTLIDQITPLVPKSAAA